MDAPHYPHVQYSAKLHTHFYMNRPAETHSHRTYLEFHGHDGLPVLPYVEVETILPIGSKERDTDVG